MSSSQGQRSIFEKISSFSGLFISIATLVVACSANGISKSSNAIAESSNGIAESSNAIAESSNAIAQRYSEYQTLNDMGLYPYYQAKYSRAFFSNDDKNAGFHFENGGDYPILESFALMEGSYHGGYIDDGGARAEGEIKLLYFIPLPILEPCSVYSSSNLSTIMTTEVYSVANGKNIIPPEDGLPGNTIPDADEFMGGDDFRTGYIFVKGHDKWWVRSPGGEVVQFSGFQEINFSKNSDEQVRSLLDFIDFMKSDDKLSYVFDMQAYGKYISFINPYMFEGTTSPAILNPMMNPRESQFRSVKCEEQVER